MRTKAVAGVLRARSLRRLRVCAVFLLLLDHLLTAAPPRSPTFEERIEAQRALEGVYASHLIRSPGQSEDPVGRDILEQKVRIYLEQSLALGRIWGVPVTRAMLDRELARMRRRTRIPERLGEMFAALADDPILLEECLA